VLVAVPVSAEKRPWFDAQSKGPTLFSSIAVSQLDFLQMGKALSFDVISPSPPFPWSTPPIPHLKAAEPPLSFFPIGTFFIGRAFLNAVFDPISGAFVSFSAWRFSPSSDLLRCSLVDFLPGCLSNQACLPPCPVGFSPSFNSCLASFLDFSPN